MSKPRRRGSSRRGKKSRSARPAEFWGAIDPDEEPVGTIRPAEEPAAVVRSLGPAPLPGREMISEHYFAAVYEKAAGLATALAATTGMLDDADDE